MILIAIVGFMLFQEKRNYLSAACVKHAATILDGYNVETSPSTTQINVDTSTNPYSIDVQTLGIFTPHIDKCKINALICTVTFPSDLVYNSDGVTVGYTASTPNSAALGFTTSSSKLEFDYTAITYGLSFSNPNIVIVCYHPDFGTSNAIVSAQLVFAYTYTATCIPTITKSDSEIAALTNTYDLDSSNSVQLYSAFSDYADTSCAGYADLVDGSANTIQLQYFVGDGTSGAIAFTRSTAWSQILKLRVCQDNTLASCTWSTQSFTITVSACTQNIADNTVLTNPSDLTLLTTTYIIDGNKPQFTSFGSFTLDTGCTVTSVQVYLDTSQTAHSDLELIQSGGSYTVQVSNTGAYYTANTYNFYIQVSIGGLSNQWVEISSTQQFQLITQLANCNTYISFSTWNAPGTTGQEIELALPGTSFTIQSAASNYVTTSDSTLCPLTSFSLTYVSCTGTCHELTLSSTGLLTATYNTVYLRQFTIKVCGNSQSDAANCVTSSSFFIQVVVTRCDSWLSFSTFQTYTNPIIGSPNGTPQQLHSSGSNYASDGGVSECAITNYDFTIQSNTGGTGTGSELTLDPTSGAFSISINTDYSYDFMITICSRGQTSGNDCITSSTQTVQVEVACILSPRNHLPNKTETLIFEDYVINGTNLIVNKTAYINSLIHYEIDCQLFFTFNCELTNYEIIQVLSTFNGSEVDHVNYADTIQLNQRTGILSLMKFNKPIDYLIKIRSYNGRFWSSSNDNPQIRIALQDIDFSNITVNQTINDTLFNNSKFIYQNNTNSTTLNIKNNTIKSDKIQINWKPICPTMSVDLNEPSELIYECLLPEIMSSNQSQKFGLRVDKLIPAMQMNELENKIIISQQLLQIKDIKQHFLKAIISDQDGNESQFVIVIKIVKKQSKNAAPIFNNATSSNKNLTAKIKDISNLGLMTIIFSQQINNVILTDINSTIIDIYVEPAQQRHLHTEQNFKINEVNLTWNTVQQTEFELQIQLDFQYPKHISPLMIQDTIIVSLIRPQDASLFYASIINQTLHPDSWTLNRYICRQMPNTEVHIYLNQVGQQIQILMLSLLVASILVYLFSQWEMAARYNFIMIRSLQMITHLPMLYISFPGNTISFTSYLLTAVGFDVLASILDWQKINNWVKIFNFKEHEKLSKLLFGQLYDIGYTSFNALMILNTVGIVLLQYVIKTIFLAILYVIASLTKSQILNIKVKKWSNGMYFNELIGLFISAYFEFLIAAILTTYLWDTVLFGEIISIGISCFTFFITCIFLPIASLYVIYQKPDKIQDEEFLERWSNLFENMNENRKDRAARFFYLFFMQRRFIFIGTCFLLRSHGVIYQVLIVLYMNLFVLIYQGYYKPAFDKFENRLELFNEYIVICCSFFMLTFTDWIETQEQIFMNGWIFITLILLHVLVNIPITIYYTIRGLILLIRKQQVKNLKTYSEYLRKQKIIQEQKSLIENYKSFKQPSNSQTKQLNNIFDSQNFKGAQISNEQINERTDESITDQRISKIQNISKHNQVQAKNQQLQLVMKQQINIQQSQKPKQDIRMKIMHYFQKINLKKSGGAIQLSQQSKKMYQNYPIYKQQYPQTNHNTIRKPYLVESIRKFEARNQLANKQMSVIKQEDQN